jgi:hypothetical protein
MSAWICRSSNGKADPKIVPPRLRIPYWKGLGADSEEKHEPVSDIETAVVDSLKVLDPERPIREADIVRRTVGLRSPRRYCASRTRQRRDVRLDIGPELLDLHLVEHSFPGRHLVLSILY